MSDDLEDDSTQAAHVVSIHILVMQIPYVAHWRMTIADVADVSWGDDPFCRPRLMADNQVIATQIELFESEWIKWKEVTMKAPAAWNMLQE
jgi:hypothetical protein